MIRSTLLLGLAIAVGGCDVIEQPSGLIPRWTSAWRQVASEDDRERLRDWRSTFQKAVTAAQRAGHGTAVASEGALLEPDAALPSPAIPNGLYRCRVIKLGAQSQGMVDYVPYPAFTCRLRAYRELQRLEKLDGSQRYVGVLFPQDAIRQVFLGTLVLGDERRAMQYRQDPTRDVAGHLERVGPARWRLVMPRPRFESRLDVMELVPSSQGAP